METQTLKNSTEIATQLLVPETAGVEMSEQQSWSLRATATPPEAHHRTEARRAAVVNSFESPNTSERVAAVRAGSTLPCPV